MVTSQGFLLTIRLPAKIAVVRTTGSSRWRLVWYSFLFDRPAGGWPLPFLATMRERRCARQSTACRACAATATDN